jgi:hypothetical protein
MKLSNLVLLIVTLFIIGIAFLSGFGYHSASTTLTKTVLIFHTGEYSTASVGTKLIIVQWYEVVTGCNNYFSDSESNSTIIIANGENQNSSTITYIVTNSFSLATTISPITYTGQTVTCD